MRKSTRPPIPEAVLKPLSTAPRRAWDEYSWSTSFSLALELTREWDVLEGGTYAHVFNDADLDVFPMALSYEEFAAIVVSSAVQPEFHRGVGCVNHYWLVSMNQFYGECQRAWNEHIARTNALIGTPSGRLLRDRFAVMPRATLKKPGMYHAKAQSDEAAAKYQLDRLLERARG